MISTLLFGLIIQNQVINGGISNTKVNEKVTLKNLVITDDKDTAIYMAGEVSAENINAEGSHHCLRIPSSMVGQRWSGLNCKSGGAKFSGAKITNTKKENGGDKLETKNVSIDHFRFEGAVHIAPQNETEAFTGHIHHITLNKGIVKPYPDENYAIGIHGADDIIIDGIVCDMRAVISTTSSCVSIGSQGGRKSQRVRVTNLLILKRPGQKVIEVKDTVGGRIP